MNLTTVATCVDDTAIESGLENDKFKLTIQNHTLHLLQKREMPGGNIK